MSRAFPWVAAAVLLTACESEPAPTMPRPTASAAERPSLPSAPTRSLESAADATLVAKGKGLVADYQCNRCHDIAGVEPESFSHVKTRVG